MITLYNAQGSSSIGAEAVTVELLRAARWIDLATPSREEEVAIEQALQIEIPTREEMQEIETSSRLYKEFGALFMTATVVAYADSGSPISTAVTFILREDFLVTVRYAEPRAFLLAANNYRQHPEDYTDSSQTMMLLFEALTDRVADLLERVNENLDTVSATIFRAAEIDKTKSNLNFKQVLIQIGKNGDLVARIRESLASLTRMYLYLGEAERLPNINTCREELAALKGDLASLSDHAGFLTSKISFLQDATLGMINIEQNAIIKAMSVVATVFLPPTLIASIYGMNFDTMPELQLPWAYPAALGLIVLSGLIPYLFFKRKGWV